MRILFLNAYFYPESIAFSHLEKDIIDSLVESGHTIEVLCPIPTRGISEETRKKYKTKKHEIMYDGKVIVHRFWAPPEKKKTLIRTFRYLWCNLRQYALGKKYKGIDLIFAVSTPPTQGFLAGKLAKKLKCKFVYSLQDIFPDSLVHTGMTKQGSLIWKIGRWIEKVTYKSADKIIVISEDFKKNIMSKGVTEDKIEIVYNWVNENQVVNVDRKDNILFDKYNLDRDRFYICYSGNIGYTQNMDMLVEVAKTMQDNKSIGFVVIGDGAYKAKLEELVEENNLNNITLIPFQDYSDISHVFSLGDVGLIISKKGVGTNSVPSKTWSIMSAERPVLASFDKGSELDKIVAENHCGVCVEADDADALKKAIFGMYNNKEHIGEMGNNGRAFVLKNLTADIGTSKVINGFKDICCK